MGLNKLKQWIINRIKWRLRIARKFWWIMPVILMLIYLLKS